jgi:hypothetical protein
MSVTRTGLDARSDIGSIGAQQRTQDLHDQFSAKMGELRSSVKHGGYHGGMRTGHSNSGERKHDIMRHKDVMAPPTASNNATSDTTALATTDTSADTSALDATNTSTDTPALDATDTSADTSALDATDTSADTSALDATDTSADTSALDATDTSADTSALDATDEAAVDDPSQLATDVTGTKPRTELFVCAT